MATTDTDAAAKPKKGKRPYRRRTAGKRANPTAQFSKAIRSAVKAEIKVHLWALKKLQRILG